MHRHLVSKQNDVIILNKQQTVITAIASGLLLALRTSVFSPTFNQILVLRWSTVPEPEPPSNLACPDNISVANMGPFSVNLD